jgi:hypothetical protein
MKKYYTQKELQECFGKNGFIVLTEKRSCNEDEITFKDDNGYLYCLKYNSYKRTILDGGKPRPFTTYNKYSLDNLKLWLSKNNKNWDILMEVYPGIEGKLRFHCNDCNHDFEIVAENLLFRNTKCLYCSGKLVSSKNSFSENYPEIAKMWDKDKNGIITPNDVSVGMHKSFWWICSKCGNSFEMPVDRMKRFNTGCPKCNEKAVSDSNNLEILFPEIAKQWDYEKNYPLIPSQIIAHSAKRVWWKCNICGHSWDRTVDGRTGDGGIAGCPACNRHVISDKNRLVLLYPEICKEWDYEKNIDIDINDVSIASAIKYWWKCDLGHSWQATTANRTRRKSGCPACSESHGEKRIRKYLDGHNIIYVHQKKFKGLKHKRTLAFDFYVQFNESKYFLLEYQGRQHYYSCKFYGGEEGLKKQQERDQVKRDYCRNNDIYLLEISYLDYNNIELLLDNFLQSFS